MYVILHFCPDCNCSAVPEERPGKVQKAAETAARDQLKTLQDALRKQWGRTLPPGLSRCAPEALTERRCHFFPK